MSASPLSLQLLSAFILASAYSSTRGPPTFIALSAPHRSWSGLYAWFTRTVEDGHRFSCLVVVQVIAIDEAQFFNDLYQFCCTAANEDQKHIIVAGLDGDFRRQKFGQACPFLYTCTHLSGSSSTPLLFITTLPHLSLHAVWGSAAGYTPRCARFS